MISAVVHFRSGENTPGLVPFVIFSPTDQSIASAYGELASTSPKPPTVLFSIPYCPFRRTTAVSPRNSVTRSYSSGTATFPALSMNPHFPSFSTAARPSRKSAPCPYAGATASFPVLST